MAIFEAHRIHAPGPITKKFGTGDYVSDPMAVSNLVQIRPLGASGQMGYISQKF